MRIVIEITPFDNRRALQGAEVAEALETLAGDFRSSEIMEEPMETGQSALNTDHYNETTVKWRVE